MKDFSVISEEPSIIWATNRLVSKRIDSNYFHIKYINYLNSVFNCGLNCKAFEDICKRMNSGPFGSALLASDYVEEGIPFIRALNCKNYIVDDEDFVFITNEDSNRLNSSSFTSGSLIITKIGNGIGDVAIIPKRNDKCNISGNLMGVEIKGAYDNYYVLSFLKSKYGQNQIWQGMMNSAKPKIDMYTIKSILIPIPSPEIQKYIGDKVRRAEELREEAKMLKEEMAKKLYLVIGLPRNLEDNYDKYGFVQNEYLDDIRIDAIYYMKKYIEYSNKLNEKELVSLGDIIKDSRYGASISANYCKTGIPFLRGLNLKENEINDDIVYLNKLVRDKIGKAIVNEGDILITRSGSVGITAVVDERQEGYGFGSFMIKLVIDREMWNSYYISAFLNSFWGKWQIERQKNGAVQQNINLQEIDRIMIPKIDLDKQKIFEILIKEYTGKEIKSKQLIQEAKQDVEDLIEGNFDMSRLNKTE